tara:strand:+ start:3143 stop:3988 length:846 start_codon:yes stop_codon:yes gene_type:complete
MIVNQQKVIQREVAQDSAGQTNSVGAFGDIGASFNKTPSTTSDPTLNRLIQAGFDGLFGEDIPGLTPGQNDAANNPSAVVGFANQDKDWRVRISIAPSATLLYRSTNPGILRILQRTDGVIFPYTPQITINHSANYSQQNITHANYKQYFYESSAVDSIQLTGEFTAQTTDDAEYLLAAIQFFRSATKMFYGDSGKYQGSPPPIVYLNGYGKQYLPNVPCVITLFSQQLPNDVDYINANNTRVPTHSSLFLQLQPVYSRTRQKEFNFDKFASGQLLNKGFL